MIHHKMQIYKAKDEHFFIMVQKYLNVFVFFLPIGIVKIAGISITFFIFLMIAYLFLKNRKKLFRIQYITDYMLIVFFMILIISIIFSEETFRPIGIVADLKTIIRLIYWMTLALFMKTWSDRFDFYQISKYMFFGILATIAFYYTLNISMEIMTQNSFAYTLVLGVPFSMYYLFKKYSFIVVLPFSAIFLYFALASTSRAGAIIVFIQLAILLFTAKYIRKKTLLFLSFILLPLFFILYFNFDTYKMDLANTLHPYSPDLSNLIAGGEQTLRIDKSWLDRKQMVIKGLDIFSEHPFLGIGFSHFKYYWVNMDIISPYLNKSMIFYNRLSAHNTYIQVLAGAGIFALSILLILELIIVKKGFKILIRLRSTPHIFIFVSFLGMIIYFYVIAAGMGAITWFVFGYALSLLHTQKNIQHTQIETK